MESLMPSLRTRANMAFILSLLAVSSFLTTGCSSAGADIEEADYRVLKADGRIEIRHYTDLLLVSTAMGNENHDVSAFRKLFRYISGDNSGEQKIAMTAPVFMDPKRSEKMSFVLPRDYSMDTAPSPDNRTVELERWQDYTLAAIRFNGRLNQENIKEHQAKLEAWLKDKRIVIEGNAKMAGYDHPMTIPALRRNEVLIPVKFSL